MGGGKDDAKIQVALYNMSIHMGICAARDGIKLLGIRVGEKWAWRGSKTDPGPIYINRENFFGGLKKEGGIGGVAYWLPGDDAQVLPNVLAKRYGVDSGEECPGYRGQASLFFVGNRSVGSKAEAPNEWDPKGTSGPKGFYWGANNPYSRPVALLVESLPSGITRRLRGIPIPGTDYRAANPAHMIYECIHNEDLGGARYGATNRYSFETAAQTLFDEGFGLCALWARQSKIEDFTNEVLDHINATLFLHPRDGRLTLKLLRADYDLALLRRIRPNQAVFKSLKRKTWGETANEIVVTYTDPDSHEEATVTAHDLAQIAAQGETVSASRNYHMVRSRRLAAVLANREISQSVRPYATIEMDMPRTGWDLVAGEVVVLEGWGREIGADIMVCRVSQVEKSSDSNTISVSLYEDIFGEGLNSYIDLPPTEWLPESVEPSPLREVVMVTAPAALTAMKRGVADPTKLVDPEAMMMILAKRNSPDDVFYELLAPVALPNGRVELRSLGVRNYHGTASVPEGGLSAKATSITTLDDLDGVAPKVGQFVLIGAPNDFEIVVVDAIDGENWTLLRGVLDTVPRTWAAGTTVWFVPEDDAIPDSAIRAAGETVTYRLRPTTSLGTLEIENTPDRTAVVGRRPHLPLRPSGVRVNGVDFGVLNASGLTHVTVTWANRNRAYEMPQVLQWNESDVTPEAGQTAVVRLLNDDWETIVEFDVGSVNTYVLDLASFGDAQEGFVQVLAKRGGDYSFQGFAVRLTNITA